MYMDLWKPTRKVLGSIVKHSAVDVKVKNHVLHEETVRQLKTRISGSKSCTLLHTLTCTPDMELVPDMCPRRRDVSITAIMLPMLWGLSPWSHTARCGRPILR